MGNDSLILIGELAVCLALVFGAHALRRRFGLGLFYALLGALTALMSWVTDAGLAVRVAGITFVVGSTVFYTSILVGVFIVYVFGGPQVTRIAIALVATVSTLVPLTAAVLHAQAAFADAVRLPLPVPSLRINAASVATTVVDFIFLAVVWEFLGSPRLYRTLRVFLTMLGVLWLDVLLFSTAAFAGTPVWLSIMGGTLITRLLVAVALVPPLLAYLAWQSSATGVPLEGRPVLAVLRHAEAVEADLARARDEIALRVRAEQARDQTIEELRRALSEVRTLRGMLPICSSCKRVRDDKGYWNAIEQYLAEHTEAELTHGICPDCAAKLYPDYHTSRDSTT